MNKEKVCCRLKGAVEIVCFCTKEIGNAIKNALINARGKGHNIMIVGPANCGKTFILKPLCDILNAFVNPACGTFWWVGVEEAEIIFLNDL